MTMDRRRAFTILELLVALVALAVITGVMVALFQSTSNVWLNATSKTDRNRVGRILSDFVSQELRWAALPVENPPPVGNPNLQFLINPPLANVPQDYQNPHCLFWQTPVATEQSRGELAEVGYFVKWERQADTAVPSLRRFFVNPTTYSSASGNHEPNPDFLIYKSWGAWLTPALLAKVAPADKRSGYEGLVAENVLGLWVRFYGADGQEIKAAGLSSPATSFDSRTGYAIWETTPSPTGDEPLTKQVFRYLPSRVTLSIAQLDARHAALLGSGWTRVRSLANDSQVRDAEQFQARFQRVAASDPYFKRLSPGLRIHETNVILENAR